MDTSLWTDTVKFVDAGYLYGKVDSHMYFYIHTPNYEITVYSDGACSIDHYTEYGLFSYYYKPLKSAKQFNKLLTLHGAFLGLI